MIDAVESLPAPEAITNWKLSKEERKALDLLPPEIMARVDELLAAYSPQSPLDIGAALVAKGLARLMMERKNMLSAMKIGYEYGGDL
jgi:hypothetical protein